MCIPQNVHILYIIYWMTNFEVIKTINYESHLQSEYGHGSLCARHNFAFNERRRAHFLFLDQTTFCAPDQIKGCWTNYLPRKGWGRNQTCSGQFPDIHDPPGHCHKRQRIIENKFWAAKDSETFTQTLDTYQKQREGE